MTKPLNSKESANFQEIAISNMLEFTKIIGYKLTKKQLIDMTVRSVSEDNIYCQGCGRLLKANERPCPTCGSGRRRYENHVKEILSFFDSHKLKHKDKTGFRKFKAEVRSKISGNTRRPARESLTIDRTDPAYTKKFHRVEEKGDDGSYHVVHEHEEKTPAKHRIKK